MPCATTITDHIVINRAAGSQSRQSKPLTSDQLEQFFFSCRQKFSKILPISRRITTILPGNDGPLIDKVFRGWSTKFEAVDWDDRKSCSEIVHRTISRVHNTTLGYKNTSLKCFQTQMQEGVIFFLWTYVNITNKIPIHLGISTLFLV